MRCTHHLNVRLALCHRLHAVRLRVPRPRNVLLHRLVGLGHRRQKRVKLAEHCGRNDGHGQHSRGRLGRAARNARSLRCGAYVCRRGAPAASAWVRGGRRKRSRRHAACPAHARSPPRPRCSEWPFGSVVLPISSRLVGEPPDCASASGAANVSHSKCAENHRRPGQWAYFRTRSREWHVPSSDIGSGGGKARQRLPTGGSCGKWQFRARTTPPRPIFPCSPGLHAPCGTIMALWRRGSPPRRRLRPTRRTRRPTRPNSPPTSLSWAVAS